MAEELGTPNPAGPAGRQAETTVAAERSDHLLARAAARLPDWVGSIRFRLAALYSLVLFGLAAVMMAGLYLGVSNQLHDERVYRTYQITEIQPVPGGFELTPREVRSEYRTVEQLANERSLDLLRTYSTTALVVLFLVSLGVGWLLAGRVLAPIGRITAVARDIEAGDLSRRINLRGPPDELRELADTFDAMLDRIDDAFDGQRRFIQEASHELRNPLAVIRTNLDVALANPESDPEELRRTAEVVSRTAARMGRLVDDLLAYARSGAPAHDPAPVDISRLVTEVGEEFGAPAAVREITVVTAVAPSLEGARPVVGDRIALRQAVANLLTNAVRLAPEGSTIALTAHVDRDRVAITVADEGPGIAPADRERVFERFWRGDVASARGDGRSGLGLAIVRQIVEEHHGTVTLEPTPAGGSAFTLWFPASVS